MREWNIAAGRTSILRGCRPPTVASRLSASRPDLQTLAAEPVENLPPALRLPTAFLLVTLGLQASPQTGAPLIARGFFAVHDALEGAVEPPEAGVCYSRTSPWSGSGKNGIVATGCDVRCRNGWTITGKPAPQLLRECEIPLTRGYSSHYGEPRPCFKSRSVTRTL